MPTDPIPLPVGGVDDREPTMLPDGVSPNLYNVRAYFNRMDRRFCWSRFEKEENETSVPPDVEPEVGHTLTMVSIGTTSTPDQFLMWNGSTVYMWDGSDWHPFQRNIVIPGLPQVDRYSVTAAPDQKVYVISTHLPLSSFDGTTYSEVVTDLNPTQVQAICLLSFNDRLIAIRTQDFSARIRWCAAGQLAKWNAGNTVGAGFLDIIDLNDHPLTGGFILNGRAYLSKQREIYELVATGQTEPAFVPVLRVAGKGMIAAFSWASADYFGFFLGPDNVYMFDGSQIQAVGDPVKELLFKTIPQRSSIVGSLLQVQGTVYTRRSEYWLLPFMGSDTLFVYNYAQNRWFIDKRQLPIWGMGEFRPADAPYVGFGNDSIVIAEKNSSDSYGTAILDEQNTTHDEGPLGTFPVEAYFETKDYYAKAIVQGQPQVDLGVLNCVKCVNFQAEPGSDYTVGVSTDHGKTWTEQSTTTNEFGVGYAFFNVSFQLIRFRIRSTSEQPFSLRGTLSYDWKTAGMSFKG